LQPKIDGGEALNNSVREPLISPNRDATKQCSREYLRIILQPEFQPIRPYSLLLEGEPLQRLQGIGGALCGKSNPVT